MVIKQALYCDTDDCMYFNKQEEGCGKGSVTIQEGSCCDYEKIPSTAETQPRVTGVRVTIDNEDFTSIGVSDYLESMIEQMEDEAAQDEGNRARIALREERKLFFRAAAKMLRGITSVGTSEEV